MLSQVILPASVHQLILSHAYSTEKEEVIGLLLGHWETVASNNPYIGTKTVAYITSIAFLTRSDKRKDRVEIAPENLHLAAIQAEDLGKRLGEPVMVIGWYHSHPHITVFPSHIDINTQLSQQLLDDRFFGLIISCFDTLSDRSEKMQITCFQSQGTEKQPVPLTIQPETKIPDHVRCLYPQLPASLYEEYKKEYKQQRIHYDLQSPQPILPDTITLLANAHVHGKLTTDLLDHLVFPVIHTLDTEANLLEKEIKDLERYKQQYLSSNSGPSTPSLL